MPIVPFSGTSVISAQQYGPDGSGRSKSFPQSKEQESAHLCRIRKPLQCPATADRALVMSRGQRFESRSSALSNLRIKAELSPQGKAVLFSVTP